MNRKDLNNVYGIPDGYFDRLEKTLMSIPSVHPLHREEKITFGRLKPYLALAASFFLIMTGGSAVLKLSSSRVAEQDFSTFEKLQLADLLPVTYQDIIYGLDDGYGLEIKSEDGISEYLIESGITLEQIEYYYEEDN